MGTNSYAAKPTAISRATPIVFVVDDDCSVRASLDRLIRSASWEPQIFGSAQEFLAHPRACTPSCLILDVGLPDLNGLELQRQIAADRVETPIIFITGHCDVPMSVKAMKAGAIEFLIKPFNDDELLGAVAQAIERSQVTLGTETETRSLRDRYEALSNREREVMDLIVAVEWLDQELYGTGLHRLHDHGNIALTGDEYYRRLDAVGGDSLLQLEPVKIG